MVDEWNIDHQKWMNQVLFFMGIEYDRMVLYNGGTMRILVDNGDLAWQLAPKRLDES